ncbi:MAG TPA: hypothetical protein VIS29_02360 [Streptomyces sp.]
MSPLPRQMINRWQNREEHGQGTIYWHILLGPGPSSDGGVTEPIGKQP